MAQPGLTKQQVGLAGMTISPDIAADVRHRYGAFVTKLGDRLAYVETKPGSSIDKFIAIPNNNDAWMTFPLGQVATATGGAALALTAGGGGQTAARQRNRNRNRATVT